MNDAQKNKLLAKYKRLQIAVKVVGQRNGSCWCGVRAFESAKASHIVHTVACDDLYLALYGAERGE